MASGDPSAGKLGLEGSSDKVPRVMEREGESEMEERDFRRAGRRVAGTGATIAVLLVGIVAVAPASASSFGALSWGSNLQRQLGDGSTEASSDVPVDVSGLTGVTAVAAGSDHGVALLSSGSVMAWGENEAGQLGDGNTTTSSVPVAVSGLSGVKAIAAGGSHSLALLSNGTVMAWGDNEFGELGDGNTQETDVPVAVKGVTNVKAIAAGADDSLALLSNGTVMAWGNDEEGQLGDGTTKELVATPAAVKSLTGVTAIAAGGQFSLALVAKGAVEAWGSNDADELGNGEIEEGSTLPVTVPGVSEASALAAGQAFALALVKGAVLAWGEDNYGQLGDGTIGHADEVPTAVSGVSGATAIAAGADHGLALLGSGSVEAWGRNSWGALGDGMAGAASDLPVAVMGLAEGAGISAGGLWSLAYGELVPSVTSLSPAAGPNSGGTAVTITGANLTGATAVKFGSTAAESFTVESPTTITAIAPAGTGAVEVHVTTAAGSSPKNLAVRYTYLLPPTIKKLSPASGPAEGGETVTITGSSLTGATAVDFGSAPATSFTVVSATEITAVAPATVVAGTAEITVTTSVATSATSAKDRFKYLPVIESVTPNSGPKGTSVTITGLGFALGGTATEIKFGSARAKIVECVSNEACTAIAPTHAAGTVEVTAVVEKVTSAKESPGRSVHLRLSRRPSAAQPEGTLAETANVSPAAPSACTARYRPAPPPAARSRSRSRCGRAWATTLRGAEGPARARQEETRRAVPARVDACPAAGGPGWKASAGRCAGCPSRGSGSSR